MQCGRKLYFRFEGKQSFEIGFICTKPAGHRKACEAAGWQRQVGEEARLLPYKVKWVDWHERSYIKQFMKMER